jgi:hypothetical protein
MSPLYIHTIFGRPAYFNGAQIVFAPTRSRRAKLVPVPMEQILREREATIKFRQAHNWDIDGYGQQEATP